MYARVVTWEGGDADAIRASSEEIASRAATGPPDGVPAVGFTLLTDPDSGSVIAVSLFETEEDLEAGAAVLEAMSPPGDGFGKRVSVASYGVAVDIRNP